jgi:trehalose 6-phosphate phosphatase
MIEHVPAPAIAPPDLKRGHALFIDFDGTLVEIAALPGLVRIEPGLRALLDSTLAFVDGAVAIVSGRPVDELANFLGPFAGTLIGQHGLERRRIDGTIVRWTAEPALALIRALFAEFAARHDGVVVEDKGCTIALHFRNAPASAADCHAIAREAVSLSGGAVDAIYGKMVVELVPIGGGKGGAIAALLAEPPFRGRTPIFVGDDSGDEEGFAVVSQRGGISIHVGDGATIAPFRLKSVARVRDWLARSVAA